MPISKQDYDRKFPHGEGLAKSGYGRDRDYIPPFANVRTYAEYLYRFESLALLPFSIIKYDILWDLASKFFDFRRSNDWDNFQYDNKWAAGEMLQPYGITMFYDPFSKTGRDKMFNDWLWGGLASLWEVYNVDWIDWGFGFFYFIPIINLPLRLWCYLLPCPWADTGFYWSAP